MSGKPKRPLVLPDESTPGDALMSAEQLAELWGVHRITLSRRRSEGKGPPFIRLSASRVRYPIRAYREWVDAQTAESSGGADAA